MLCGRLGNQEEALAFFLQAAEFDDAQALFNLGNTYRALGRAAEAIPVYEAAVAGGNVDAIYNLGRTFEDRGEEERALQIFLEAGKAGDSKGWVSAGWILEDQGEMDRSLTLLRSAAKSSDLARGALGERLWKDGNSGEAESYLRQGLQEYPDARVILAKIYLERNMHSTARVTLEEGVAEGDVDCFLPLGNLLMNHYDSHAEAEQAFRAGLGLGDNNCRYNLAVLLCQVGRGEEAAVLVREAADLGDPLAVADMNAGPPQALPPATSPSKASVVSASATVAGS